jgi:uncharacterized protein YeaO (DUF488 family)
MLHVSTSRLSKTPIDDALDITRKTADDFAKRGQVSPGAFLAPSWPLLKVALDARWKADELNQRASAELSRNNENAARRAEQAAVDVLQRAWRAYVPKYIDEMRRSFRRNQGEWAALLARETVTLQCFCIDAEHCHRWILRTIILPKCGALDVGER